MKFETVFAFGPLASVLLVNDEGIFYGSKFTRNPWAKIWAKIVFERS